MEPDAPNAVGGRISEAAIELPIGPLRQSLCQRVFVRHGLPAPLFTIV